MLDRRKFILTAGGLAGAAAGGGLWASLVRDGVENAAGPGGPADATTSTTTAPESERSVVPVDERVLVVLELAGGNDALNTLVPAVGSYRSARPTIAIPESDVVGLTGTDEYGLHPELAPLIELWEAGDLAAIAGVGMVGQSRSHFKAMDTWWSATPGAGSTTGWLGRWLDATLEGEPDPLRAIALGGGSPALVGESSLSTVVHSPAQFRLRTTEATDTDAMVAAFMGTAAPLETDPVLAAAQAAIPTTLAAVDLFDEVTGGSDPIEREATNGPESAASLLATAAGIIDLGIGTRVMTVGVGGFDTHAGQLGTHDGLLAGVAEGIGGFFDLLDRSGRRDEVMLMTTSEFGRRVAENGSGGTDHGQAGVQFLAGPVVNGGRVVGDLDLDRLDDGDVPTVVDTRSLYSVALDWLGGPTDELLDGPHDRLGLVA